MPERPVALPPEERPVGQLVAETIRLYGENFWRALPLGLPLALAAQVNYGRATGLQVAVFCVFAPLFSAAYLRGCVIVLGVAVSWRRLLFAWGLGILVWIPAPLLLRAYLIPGLAWLAFWGLAVPVALHEGLGAKAALGRARRLALADFIHALGSLCTLLLIVELTAIMLSALLHSQGDTTRRTAGFIALVVLSPLLYLGSGLLYLDQEARANRAVDTDSAGRSDARVER